MPKTLSKYDFTGQNHPENGVKAILITDTFIPFNSDLYSVRDKEIIKYETIGNNELKEREICTIPNDNTYWEFLHHYARNTMVTNGNLEFDGEKCIVLERQISIDNLRTSKAWYSYKTQLSLK